VETLAVPLLKTKRISALDLPKCEGSVKSNACNKSLAVILFIRAEANPQSAPGGSPCRSELAASCHCGPYLLREPAGAVGLLEETGNPWPWEGFHSL
jgi:hypothetical protein